MWPAGIGLSLMAMTILLLMAGASTPGADRARTLVFVAETWFVLGVLGVMLWTAS
jgi:hypothetical protein